jgi:hypothetical protein
MSTTADPLLDKIPPPRIIRSRLAALMPEQDLLRSLLRVSERKEREQSGGRRLDQGGEAGRA